MRTPHAILIGIITLLLGFFFRNALEPSASDRDRVSAPAELPSSTRVMSSQRQSIERSMRIPESTQRWLNVVALLEKAKLSEMQGIAQLIGYEDDRITTLVAQRWLELDPQHFFKSCLAEIERTPSGSQATFSCYLYMEFLAKEWPQRDFEAAFAAFSRPDPNRDLDDAKNEFLNHLVKMDLDRAIEVSRLWEYGFANNGYLRGVAEKDPRAIALTIFSHYDTTSESETRDPFSQDPFSQGLSRSAGGDLIGIVAEVWGASDPVAALAFANSHKNDQGRFLQDEIVATWFAKDQAAAARWLEDQSAEIQEKYRPNLVKAWAVEDSQSALAWCSENLQDPASYQAAVDALIAGAVRGDLRQAAALIPELEGSNFQSNILSQVTRKWFSPENGESIPAEAVDWLRDLGDSRLGKLAMSEAGERWAENDPDGMKAFLEEERDFDYYEGTYGSVVEALTKRDPVAGLEWAASLGGRSEEQLQTASRIWITQRPEAALNWLRHSPGNPRAEAAVRQFLATMMADTEGAETLLQNLGRENQDWVKARFD